MVYTETHTAEEWKKKLGDNLAQLATEPKMTKEEYIKMLKKQETAKELLTAGKNILGGIAQRVGSAGKKFLVGLGNRLATNYNTAVGTPVFGTTIRELLGANQNSTFPMQNPYAVQNPYQRYVQNPYAVQNPYQRYLQNPYAVQNSYATQNLGPQYPKEIYSITPEIFMAAQNPQQPVPPQPTPSPSAAPQPMSFAVPAAGNQIQAPVAEPQVVFFFDKASNTISEILNEFSNIPSAEAEVARLRKQGLPAFYATKGDFVNMINSNRMKA
ncbi:MAG: hypothetical protein QXN16_00565 [Candidatus Micrarchaeaceae archaeon]